jgi:hypothetical protein
MQDTDCYDLGAEHETQAVERYGDWFRSCAPSAPVRAAHTDRWAARLSDASSLVLSVSRDCCFGGVRAECIAINLPSNPLPGLDGFSLNRLSL